MLVSVTHISTRWYSIQDMITVRIKIQSALNLLCFTNPKFTHLALTTPDWALLDIAVKYLRNFKILSKTLFGDQYITSPSLIVDLCFWGM